MAVTDYLKKKPLEVTSQNDAGATIDKAQPVLLTGSEELYDISAYNFNKSTSEVDVQDFIWNNDGSKAYLIRGVDSSTTAIREYLVSTPYDFSTSSFNQDLATPSSNPKGIAWNNDGTQLFLVDIDSDEVYEYNLTTPYDIGTASQNLSFALPSGSPQDIVWNDDGSKFYIADITLGEIREYTLTTNFDISTASFNQAFTPSVNSSFYGLAWNDDGTKLYATDANNNELVEYNLTTPYDIGTASRNQAINSQDAVPKGITFNNDGSKLYESGNNIYEYTASPKSDTDTGTGDIVLDWTNISSESDIAVYDQNGNLLPYEIESFDATAETATLWPYGSWTRDDSVQAQIVYGNGPATSEEGTATEVWGNTGQNAEAVYYFNESSGKLIDRTGNGYDASVTGTSRPVDSQIGKGYDFDGVDDIADLDTDIPNQSAVTMILHINEDTPNDGDNDNAFYLQQNNFLQLRGDGAGNFRWTVSTNFTALSTSISANTDYTMYGTWDGSTMELFKDAVSQGTASESLNDSGAGADSIGADTQGNGYFDGVISDARLYSEDKSTVTGWIQADYDASPKAGQVFFSQQAAQNTAQTSTDTAVTTTYQQTAQTSSEINNRFDTATTTQMAYTALTSQETKTNFDTAVTTSYSVTSNVTTELNNAFDTATTTGYTLTPQTSLEGENFTDTATTTSYTITAQQTTESQVNVDTAVTASYSLTPQTSNEVVINLDTAVTASYTQTAQTTTEINNVTDTATTANYVLTGQESSEANNRFDTAVTTSYSITSQQSIEFEVIEETAQTASYSFTAQTTTEQEVILEGMTLDITLDASKPLSINNKAE